ncbi:MAG: C39 family peptidase [Candidatus Obscuribacterales bacterium]|nr:C39 family peptidase [Candidatus Obscuribacterales bacterium]
MIFISSPASGAESSSAKAEPIRTLPGKAVRVPLTRQSSNYTCGAAALQSIFGFYGDEYREDVLARLLKSGPRHGTNYHRIERLARSKGYEVRSYENLTVKRLKEFLDDGKPVICLIQAWSETPCDYSDDWQDGHYVVAIGYDTTDFFFMDPSTLGNYTYIPEKEFLARWHDTDGKEVLVNFGMVISKSKSGFDTLEVKKIE